MREPVRLYSDNDVKAATIHDNTVGTRAIRVVRNVFRFARIHDSLKNTILRLHTRDAILFKSNERYNVPWVHIAYNAGLSRAGRKKKNDKCLMPTRRRESAAAVRNRFRFNWSRLTTRFRVGHTDSRDNGIRKKKKKN